VPLPQPLRSAGIRRIRTPVLGALVVLALTGGAVFETRSYRSTPTLVAHSHPGPLSAAHSPAGRKPVASTPTRPTGGLAASAPSDYARLWQLALAHHPEPPVYAGTGDRGIDCNHLKCIALTFDDGPGPETTDSLLEILAVEHVRATFFVVGHNVRENPGPTIRAAWDGHEIGIHTWDHQSLRTRSVAAVADDITRTADEITRWTGVHPTIVRPPYGAMDRTTSTKIPYSLILWSVDPDDWRDHNAKLVTKRITKEGAPGAIVLMHDVYPSTLAAVPGVIAFYKAHGYTFVTVSELYNSRLQAHHVYHGREATVAAARAADDRAHIHREPWVDPELRDTPDDTPDDDAESTSDTAPDSLPADPISDPASAPDASPTDPAAAPPSDPDTAPSDPPNDPGTATPTPSSDRYR